LTAPTNTAKQIRKSSNSPEYQLTGGVRTRPGTPDIGQAAKAGLEVQQMVAILVEIQSFARNVGRDQKALRPDRRNEPEPLCGRPGS
jgi:hypothetical protein